jgi:hypothetical protein
MQGPPSPARFELSGSPLLATAALDDAPPLLSLEGAPGAASVSGNLDHQDSLSPPLATESLWEAMMCGGGSGGSAWASLQQRRAWAPSPSLSDADADEQWSSALGKRSWRGADLHLAVGSDDEEEGDRHSLFAPDTAVEAVDDA